MNTQMRHQANGKINIVFNDEQKTLATQTKMNQHHQKLKWVDEQLSNYVGLTHLKEVIKEIYATKLLNNKREQMGLSVHRQVLHMIFKGNPGTGKTSIARELATILNKLEILSKGQFIEAERADLVGEYIGQTAQKTRNLVQKALGGILFIDEAYSLARGGHKDFGREAIDTLVKQMEDHSQDFMLILAGYPAEMNHFLKLNPGLSSRFPFHISFPNYNVQQLADIAIQMTKEREYILCNKAIWKLKNHMKEQILKQNHHFANARYVRNVIESGIRTQAIRLLDHEHCSLQDLMEIKAEDIQLES